MVLSSLYEFSARRSAALEESGGEAAAFILLDVKKTHNSSLFGEKTESLAVPPNPGARLCAKQTTIFGEAREFRSGRLYTPC